MRFLTFASSLAIRRQKPANRRVAWVTAIALACSIVAAPVIAERQQPPAGGEPKEFDLPALEVVELDNGLRVTMVPFGRVPKVQIQVVVRTGNIDETAEQVWLADLLGSMLEEGAGDLDSSALARAFASMGGELKIRVGLDSTTLSSHGLSEKAPQLLELLGKVTTSPTLPGTELDRLKNSMARRLAISRTQPASLANEKFFEALYGAHPYGRTFPAEESVTAYSLEMLRAFHRQEYGAKRTQVYVVGVFDQAATTAAVERAFGSWQAGKEPTVNIPGASPRGDRLLLVDRPGAAQSTVRFGLPMIDPSHEDYLALLVTNTLLGGSFASRITANLREDKGYTYSPRSFTATRYRSAYWALQADITTEHTGAAMAEVLKEIERLAAEPPPVTELDGIKNYLAGAFVRINSNPRGIAFQLHYVDFHGLGKDHMRTYVQRIRAVTPEDVQRIVRTYLRPEDMVLAVAGDKAQIAQQLESFGTLRE